MTGPARHNGPFATQESALSMAEHRRPVPIESSAPELAVVAVDQPAARRSVERGAVVVWSVAVASLLLFLAFGSVPIEAGWFPGLRSERVTSIWADYGDQLSASRTSTGLRELALDAALVLFLVGSGAALWFALTARDQVPATPPEPLGTGDLKSQP